MTNISVNNINPSSSLSSQLLANPKDCLCKIERNHDGTISRKCLVFSELRRTASSDNMSDIGLLCREIGSLINVTSTQEHYQSLCSLLQLLADDFQDSESVQVAVDMAIDFINKRESYGLTVRSVLSKALNSDSVDNVIKAIKTLISVAPRQLNTDLILIEWINYSLNEENRNEFPGFSKEKQAALEMALVCLKMQAK